MQSPHSFTVASPKALADLVPARLEPTFVPPFLTSSAFTLLMGLGLALGLAVGAAQRTSGNETQRVVFDLEYPGVIFLQAMTMGVPFLDVCAVSVAAAYLGPSAVAKALGWCVLYTFATQCTANIATLLLTAILQPGHQARPLLQGLPTKPASADLVSDAVLGFLSGMFPRSIVGAFVYTWADTFYVQDYSGDKTSAMSKATFGFNSYGLICFGLLFGMVLAERCDDDEVIFDILETFTRGLLHISQLVAWAAPVALGSLMMSWALRLPDMGEVFSHMTPFVAVVFLTCAFQLFVVLPCACAFALQPDGKQFLWRIRNCILIPIATMSSLSSMPLAMAFAESGCDMDTRLSRLLLPVLVSARKDVSGAVRMTMAMSVAQAQGVPLGVHNILVLLLTASASGFMAYGERVEEARVVSRVVLNSLPIMVPTDIPFEPAVRLLDPLLTATNVAGDCVGLAILHSVAALKGRRASRSGLPASNDQPAVDPQLSGGQEGASPVPN